MNVHMEFTAKESLVSYSTEKIVLILSLYQKKRKKYIYIKGITTSPFGIQSQKG